MRRKPLAETRVVTRHEAAGLPASGRVSAIALALTAVLVAWSAGCAGADEPPARDTPGMMGGVAAVIGGAILFVLVAIVVIVVLLVRGARRRRASKRGRSQDAARGGP